VNHTLADSCASAAACSGRAATEQAADRKSAEHDQLVVPTDRGRDAQCFEGVHDLIFFAEPDLEIIDVSSNK